MFTLWAYRQRAKAAFFRPPRSNRGLTLIEVLVSITIIGILIALLIPAIQAAREASRRSQCSNNLRQLGIGLQAYGAALGCYPNGLNGMKFSVHSMILPYLEQKNLYNTINWDFGSEPGENMPNGTALLLSVSLFLCPDDSGHFPWGGTSYAGCIGISNQSGREGLLIHTQDRLASLTVPDGASTTVAMSEWLRGMNLLPLHKNQSRLVFNTRSLTRPEQFEQFAGVCREATPLTTEVPLGFSKGANWLEGQLGETLFNSVLPPNSNTCLNANQPPKGAWSTSSQHPGGVNALFGDGHVKWIGSDINVHVWRALGTRNGGEIIPNDSF